jgi:hypothetical protein
VAGTNVRGSEIKAVNNAALSLVRNTFAAALSLLVGTDG